MNIFSTLMSKIFGKTPSPRFIFGTFHPSCWSARSRGLCLHDASRVLG